MGVKVNRVSLFPLFALLAIAGVITVLFLRTPLDPPLAPHRVNDAWETLVQAIEQGSQLEAVLLARWLELNGLEVELEKLSEADRQTINKWCDSAEDAEDSDGESFSICTQ